MLKSIFFADDVEYNVFSDEIFTPEIVNLTDKKGTRVLHIFAFSRDIPILSFC